MFTQCPKCQTTFRVTATTLKAAKGRARCGRCATVFDALAFLREDRQLGGGGARSAGRPAIESPRAEPSPPASAQPRRSPDAGSADIPESALEFHLPADELGKVFVAAPAPTLKLPITGTDAAPRSTKEETAAHDFVDISADGEASVEVITLEGESFESTSDGFESTSDGEERAPASSAAGISKEPEHDEPAPAARAPIKESRREAAARIDAEVAREIETAFASDPTTEAEFILPSGKRLTLNRGSAEAHAEELLAPARGARGVVPWRWIAGSAVLGVLLIVQLVHVNRQSLVRSAVLGPPLSAIYAGFGAELSPAWDVNAYELRQWGAAADPGSSGTLRVRASVLNGADHAQPYPLLRLTLQDRFGGRVGSRDLEPREYLDGEPVRRLLGAGQRIDAEIAIIDPGKDAVGFEIDVCLRDPAGLRCAGDQPRHTG